MTDVLTKKQRSYCMSQIHGRNTGLEKVFKKHLRLNSLKGFRIGYTLEGKPDFVLPSKKIAIFLDGCFWHKCPKCFSLPSSNRSFWKNKIDSNALRDSRVNKELRNKGYSVIRFWQHQIDKDIDVCIKRIKSVISKI
jgi:DNA mismatch endonuclease (patch repair protein)